MATKAVCVLKSEKVNGVVRFTQEVNSSVLSFSPNLSRTQNVQEPWTRKTHTDTATHGRSEDLQEWRMKNQFEKLKIKIKNEEIVRISAILDVSTGCPNKF